MVNGDNAWGELVDDIVLVAGVTIETAENFLAKRGYTPDDDCAVSPATRDGLICPAGVTGSRSGPGIHRGAAGPGLVGDIARSRIGGVQSARRLVGTPASRADGERVGCGP
jgi:hypothetical protein